MFCEVCEDRKLIEREGKTIRCECVRKLNTQHFIKWSEIDAKEHAKLLKDLEDRKVFFEYEEEGKIKRQIVSIKDELKLLIQDRKENIADHFKILLKGTNGRGKSQFAVTLALEILIRMDLKKTDIDMNKFFFFNPLHLIIENKIYSDERKKEIFEKIKQADVLILDELGEELELFTYNAQEKTYIPNDKRVTELHRLIKYILDNFKGLVIMTSNLDNPEEHYKKISPRMHSRLFTSGSMSTYLFGGTGLDERSKKQAVNQHKYKNRFRGESNE